MGKLNRHWTSQSTDDFLYSIGSTFVRQIESAMEVSGTTQAALARGMGISEGRVSQVLNNPGNLTLRKIIEYTRALGKKVCIVTYDDGDPENLDGPIDAEIFNQCWIRSGKPRDYFALEKPLEIASSGDGMVLCERGHFWLFEYPSGAPNTRTEFGGFDLEMMATESTKG